MKIRAFICYRNHGIFDELQRQIARCFFPLSHSIMFLKIELQITARPFRFRRLHHR